MDASAEAKAKWLFWAVLLVLAAAAASAFLLAGARSTTYELRTREAVSGLIAGAPVEFHGVEVGQVRSVRLLEPRLVQVLLDLRRDTPVTTSTVATITGRGLAARGFTGYVYVALEDGGGSSAPLAASPDGPYPRLAVGPSRQVNMDASFEALNRNVQEVNALLQSALDRQTLASLRQSLQNLDRLTASLAAHDGQLARILANAEKASVQMQSRVLPQAEGTLARMDALTAASEQRLAVILRNAEQASTQFGPLLQASQETVRSLQSQVLPEAQHALARLDQLSGTLNDTVVRIRRDPSLLVRGTSATLGPGEAQ